MSAKVLDKTDIAALRKADSICIDYALTGLHYIESDGAIRAIKKAQGTDPFEQTHIIQVNARADGYKMNGGKVRKAFAYFPHNKLTEELQTIWSLLRTGDILEVRFTASNNSQVLDEVNLHNDELRLVITRKSGKELSFLMDQHTSKNNSARMCKVY